MQSAATAHLSTFRSRTTHTDRPHPSSVAGPAGWSALAIRSSLPARPCDIMPDRSAIARASSSSSPSLKSLIAAGKSIGTSGSARSVASIRARSSRTRVSSDNGLHRLVNAARHGLVPGPPSSSAQPTHSSSRCRVVLRRATLLQHAFPHLRYEPQSARFAVGQVQLDAVDRLRVRRRSAIAVKLGAADTHGWCVVAGTVVSLRHPFIEGLRS